MKTGSSRLFRRPALIVAALFAALALAALTGCADSAPVAAPTSTLPETTGDGSSTDPTEVDIPEYETELDLTAEEEEAVDGALEAFEGFLRAINQTYSGHLEFADKFPTVASGEALESIQTEADSIATGKATFSGEIVPLEVEIFDVQTSDQAEGPSSVSINFCVDTSQWTMTQAGETPTTNPDGKVTMQHTVELKNGTWTVDQQSLWERSC